MALEISMDHPNFPKGFEFDIPGVGAVPNGGSVIVSDDAEDMYATMHQGRLLKDDLKNSGDFKVKASSQKAFEEQEEKKAKDAEKVSDAGSGTANNVGEGVSESA